MILAMLLWLSLITAFFSALFDVAPWIVSLPLIVSYFFLKD